jgi:hypothetical protein
MGARSSGVVEAIAPRFRHIHAALPCRELVVLRRGVIGDRRRRRVEAPRGFLRPAIQRDMRIVLAEQRQRPAVGEREGRRIEATDVQIGGMAEGAGFDSITEFVFAPSPVRGRRSQRVQDPQGRRRAEWNRRIELPLPHLTERLQLHGAAIHLSHARSRQDVPRRKKGPGKYQSFILSRRQDRRPRRQRGGQIDAFVDHGGDRQGVFGRRFRRRRRPRRLSAAGAAARRQS